VAGKKKRCFRWQGSRRINENRLKGGVCKVKYRKNNRDREKEVSNPQKGTLHMKGPPKKPRRRPFEKGIRGSYPAAPKKAVNRLHRNTQKTRVRVKSKKGEKERGSSKESRRGRYKKGGGLTPILGGRKKTDISNIGGTKKTLSHG